MIGWEDNAILKGVEQMKAGEGLERNSTQDSIA